MKENDLLEETLAIAARGYAEAYRFLLEEFEENPDSYGPQTLYFLACLAGGANLPEIALEWLKKAVMDNGWWYRPQVLEDEDLALLKDNHEFLLLKNVSYNRYAHAVSKAKASFSWERKKTDNIFLAVHGNTQNGQMAGEDWKPAVKGNPQWQLETIQSAEPDGYGTYRWSYDMESYLPVAEAIKKMQNEDYQKIACGGFSAGCDMLLRAALFTSARCDMLFLQSPWIPILQDYAEDLVNVLKQKNTVLKIFCGSNDEDCIPMAKQLYKAANRQGLSVELIIQTGNRHQFPKEPVTVKDLL